jgi:hypothetical protein
MELTCNTCEIGTVQTIILPSGKLYVCKNCGQSEILLNNGQDIAVVGNAANTVAILQASPANPAPVETAASTGIVQSIKNVLGVS